MNTDRINQVADAIEQHSIPWLGFNMRNFIIEDRMEFGGFTEVPDHSGHNCRTVACIAGWTNAIRLNLSEDDIREIGVWSDDFTAAKWLGIQVSDPDGGLNSEREQLFYAHNHLEYMGGGISYEVWSRISAAQAVRTLRHFATTGKVDWTV